MVHASWFMRHGSNAMDHVQWLMVRPGTLQLSAGGVVHSDALFLNIHGEVQIHFLVGSMPSKLLIRLALIMTSSLRVV